MSRDLIPTTGLEYHIAVAVVQLENGRSNQKWRTRKALVDATVQLIRAGGMPSVAEVADAARVSRTTAYRYFPTQEHLLSEGVLLSAVEGDLQRASEIAQGPGTPEQRVDAIVRNYHAWIQRTKPAARAVLAASLQAGAAADGGAANIPRRPGYAVPLLGQALAPLKSGLGAKRFSRLVSALVLCLSVESSVTLEDVCRLDAKAAEDVQRWAARTLVRGAIAETQD